MNPGIFSRDSIDSFNFSDIRFRIRKGTIMRKLRRVLTVVLLSLSIFCVPVLARDTDVNLVNFYIPAQQKLAEYYLDAYCHGSYLFVNLVKTGSKTDKENFRAVDSSETQLTTWGMAAEGGGKATAVFTDNRVERTVHKVYFKSAEYNWGGYTINGTMTY